MFTYGVFDSEDAAADGVKALTERGFLVADIGAAMAKESTVEEIDVHDKSTVTRGALLGAAFGAGGAGLLALGPVLLAAGPLAAAAQAAGYVGALGAVAGGSAGLGIWRNDVEFPEKDLKAGRIIVGVETSDRSGIAESALRNAGADPTGRVDLGSATGVAERI